MVKRSATIERKTRETEIKLDLNIDGNGVFEGSSGVGFFDHMLELLSKHGEFHLMLCAKGDTQVDDHHTVEDVGICLGRAFKQAIGDKKGIVRYASLVLPMDEALVLCAVDICGRPGLFSDISFPTEKIGQFDSQLVLEFWQAFVNEAGLVLHVRQLAGLNSHHIAESVFKGIGQVLKRAVKIESDKIPSSKGVL